jgi:CO/xanthine dehydrogenase Mo-binding subunit
MDQTRNLIRSSPRRVRLLVGAGRNLDDMTRDGLLHLGVARSPHGHARIRSDRPAISAAAASAPRPGRRLRRPVLR